eukprot:Skav232511  [mRNA]  locus=scaffold1096:607101:609675:+ [translate_table: standard]
MTPDASGSSVLAAATDAIAEPAGATTPTASTMPEAQDPVTVAILIMRGVPVHLRRSERSDATTRCPSLWRRRGGRGRQRRTPGDEELQLDAAEEPTSCGVLEVWVELQSDSLRKEVAMRIAPSRAHRRFKRDA